MRPRLPDGVTELGCHPGLDRDLDSSYRLERLREVETLCDPRVLVSLEAAGVPKGYTISPKAVDNSARTVPELAKGKPVYTRVAYEVVVKKAELRPV